MEDDFSGFSATGFTDSLAKYTVNLNERAHQGKIDPLIGRDFEVERTARLVRIKKTTRTVTGGVGKQLLQKAWR